MHDDKEMEDLLRRALRTPLPLPEDFAGRIATRVKHERWHAQAWRRAAAAVVALALLGGAGEGYRLARIHHADQVAAEVTVAVEIAQTALAETEKDAHAQVQDALQAAQPNQRKR